MKKYLFTLVAAMLTLGFTACEDIPAPYGIFGNGGTLNTTYSASFENGTDGFTFDNESLAEGLSSVWSQASYNGNGYLYASAFVNNAAQPAVAWAISPAIDLSDSKDAKLTFSHAINKANGADLSQCLTLWASTDYDGSAAAATWKQLEIPNYSDGASWTFVESGAIDLADFCGKENVVLGFRYESTAESAPAWEVDNILVKSDGSSTTGGGDTPLVAEGEGTLEAPYNSVAANELASSLESGAESDYVYIKGKISSIKEEYSTTHGNATFYISPDGTPQGQFYVYRALYLGNKKFTDGDTQIKVGDEVIVYAKLTNYMGNTPETVQGACYLYSLNGQTAGGDQPGGGDSTGEAKGSGTAADPYNSVAANLYASSLASGQNSPAEVYIKGKVVSVKEQFGTQFGNASFYISDDGTSTDQFYVYRALYLGNQKYTSGTLLNVGDEVVVCGLVTNYMGNTPETVQGQAYVVSINGETEPGEGGGEVGGGDTPDVPSGENILDNSSFEQWDDASTPTAWKSTTTASNATLSQSTDARTGSYSVKVGFYASANKRLATREYDLSAGTYTMSCYVKGDGQVRLGYAHTPNSTITYVYDDNYTTVSAGQWTLVTYTFTLAADTKVNLLMMNPKSSSYAEASDKLVDDFTLVKH